MEELSKFKKTNNSFVLNVLNIIDNENNTLTVKKLIEKSSLNELTILSVIEMNPSYFELSNESNLLFSTVEISKKGKEAHGNMLLMLSSLIKEDV